MSVIKLGSLVHFLPLSDRVVASIRASRTESFFQQIGLSSLKLLVPLGQAQRKPKTIRWASGPSAPAQAGRLSRMQVSYKVRFSQSPWPRVMRLNGQLSWRSVDGGKTRLCIELRNQFSARPTLLCQGEGNRRKRRVRCRLHGVQDQRHDWKQSSRKLGDLRNIPFFDQSFTSRLGLCATASDFFRFEF